MFSCRSVLLQYSGSHPQILFSFKNMQGPPDALLQLNPLLGTQGLHLSSTFTSHTTSFGALLPTSQRVMFFSCLLLVSLQAATTKNQLMILVMRQCSARITSQEGGQLVLPVLRVALVGGFVPDEGTLDVAGRRHRPEAQA